MRIDLVHAVVSNSAARVEYKHLTELSQVLKRQTVRRCLYVFSRGPHVTRHFLHRVYTHKTFQHDISDVPRSVQQALHRKRDLVSRGEITTPHGTRAVLAQALEIVFVLQLSPDVVELCCGLGTGDGIQFLFHRTQDLVYDRLSDSRAPGFWTRGQCPRSRVPAVVLRYRPPCLRAGGERKMHICSGVRTQKYTVQQLVDFIAFAAHRQHVQVVNGVIDGFTQRL